MRFHNVLRVDFGQLSARPIQSQSVLIAVKYCLPRQPLRVAYLSLPCVQSIVHDWLWRRNNSQWQQPVSQNVESQWARVQSGQCKAWLMYWLHVRRNMPRL